MNESFRTHGIYSFFFLLSFYMNVCFCWIIWLLTTFNNSSGVSNTNSLSNRKGNIVWENSENICFFGMRKMLLCSTACRSLFRFVYTKNIFSHFPFFLEHIFGWYLIYRVRANGVYAFILMYWKLVSCCCINIRIMEKILF